MAVLRHMSDTDLKELGVPMVISPYLLFLLILYISWQQVFERSVTKWQGLSDGCGHVLWSLVSSSASTCPSHLCIHCLVLQILKMLKKSLNLFGCLHVLGW